MKPIVVSAILAAACLALTGCGSKVRDRTYQSQDHSALVQVEFKSGGKAYVFSGPPAHPCIYRETDTKLALLCDDATTVFSVSEDGVLTGPPDSQMARLTLKD